MAKISIIIPTYNRAGMLEDAVRSVLAQTCEDWELIIVDDGSHDGTAERVKNWDDPRLRYVYQDNTGLPGARNTGIRRSHAPYVAFLDSDDLFLPDKLRLQSALLDSRPELGLVAGGWREVDAELSKLRDVRPWLAHPTLELRDWLLTCPFCPSVVMVRRTWLERAGLFDERMRRVEDWDLWLRLAYEGCPMAWVTAGVSAYRIHGGNMILDVELMQAGMIRMFDKLYARPDLSADLLDLRSAAYSNAYLDSAARAYAAGAWSLGEHWLAEAIRLEPRLLEGRPARLLASLAAFARTPLVHDSEEFLLGVMAHLPASAAILAGGRRSVRGLLHAVAAFEHYREQEPGAGLRDALAAVWADPTWMRQRGLMSLSARAAGLRRRPDASGG